MPLQLVTPDIVTSELCQKIWEQCDSFGKYERDYDIIRYLDPRDEEDAYKGLTDYLLRLGPGFSIHKIDGVNEVRESFIFQAFEFFEEIESAYGLVLESTDLAKLIFREDQKTLWEDVYLPKQARVNIGKNLKSLEDWIWDIKIDDFPITGVCCTEKWVIMPKDVGSTHSLMQLERLRAKLVMQGRLKDGKKARMLIKTCGCT